MNRVVNQAGCCALGTLLVILAFTSSAHTAAPTLFPQRVQHYAPIVGRPLREALGIFGRPGHEDHGALVYLLINGELKIERTSNDLVQSVHINFEDRYKPERITDVLHPNVVRRQALRTYDFEASYIGIGQSWGRETQVFIYLVYLGDNGSITFHLEAKAPTEQLAARAWNDQTMRYETKLVFKNWPSYRLTYYGEKLGKQVPGYYKQMELPRT